MYGVIKREFIELNDIYKNVLKDNIGNEILDIPREEL
jgi:hypothetical protein